MKGLRTSGHRPGSILGAVLLTVGSAILFIGVGSLILQFDDFLNGPGASIASLVATIGMALFHMVQVVAFEHFGLFSVLSNILVSFSAFVVVVAGLALLLPQSVRPAKSGRLSSPALTGGDR